MWSEICLNILRASKLILRADTLLCCSEWLNEPRAMKLRK